MLVREVGEEVVDQRRQSVAGQARAGMFEKRRPIKGAGALGIEGSMPTASSAAVPGSSARVCCGQGRQFGFGGRADTVEDARRGQEVCPQRGVRPDPGAGVATGPAQIRRAGSQDRPPSRGAIARPHTDYLRLVSASDREGLPIRSAPHPPDGTRRPAASGPLHRLGAVFRWGCSLSEG